MRTPSDGRDASTSGEIPSTLRYDVALGGCAPTPLASYLKALGILRLVAEQADGDANARGFWRDDAFILVSRLDPPSLQEFLLERYHPTPLVAPWGGRSGFYSGSSEASARAALERILESDLERLAPFRETITGVRTLLERLGMTDKVRDDAAKLELLRACRAELPDHLLPWLDACYVLTDEDRGFPPLLGTGGNEGSGSYVSGFAQQVIACMIDRAHDDALAAALFATPRPRTGSRQTPGQFAPLAAGGVNATSGFEAGPVLNPWDFLLCLEGTLLFAAAATKRLDASSPGALAYPFTVRTVGAGAGSVALGDEPNARAETWFPLWERPATLGELTAILGEGRVQVSGRTARDALDFARAVAGLGLQRGITAFQRYAYLQRFGRNVIAVPVDRVEVRRNARGDLVEDLDRGGWLARFRAAARRRDPVPPARLRSLVSRLEDSMFDLMRSGDATRVQAVLVRLGEAQAYLARSPVMREIVPPVPTLGQRWVHAADDGSPEFRIAASLAGLHGMIGTEDGASRATLPMAIHFAPVDERRRWVESDHDMTWGPGGVTENLAALAKRRLERARRANLIGLPWLARTAAPVQAVAAWLGRDLDDTRIRDLLPGLVLTRMPATLAWATIDPMPLPPAYSVLKLLFAPREQLLRALPGSSDARGTDHQAIVDAPGLRDASTIVRLLEADRVPDAVALGVRRLRAMGTPTLTSLEQAGHPRDGRRLLAAVLVPLSDPDLRRVARRVLRENEEASSTPSTSNTEA
jgi:CRISPR-associated protein Csx17